MKHKLKNEVHIILCISLLIVTISLALYIDYSKNNLQEKKQNFNNIIDAIIAENNYNKDNTTYTIIGDKYISVIDKTNTYPSGTIRNENNTNVSIESVLKEDKITDFNVLVTTTVTQKYPAFISETILNENNRSYEITDDKITIYFSNENINPTYDKRLSIDLGCQDISNFLNYECHGTKEYSNNPDELGKVVALTFDDGPTKDKTDRVVEILKKNKANATFFMVGNKITYQNKPSILNVLNNNNEIGSHSYSHKMLTRLQEDAILNEINSTNANFKEITGLDLYLVRPPYGSSNKKVRNTLTNPFIMWNLDTMDWKSKNANKVYDKVITTIEDGDIILMHDSYESTIAALEQVLPKLYTMGYKVTTVSNLAQLKNQTILEGNTYRYFK